MKTSGIRYYFLAVVFIAATLLNKTVVFAQPNNLFEKGSYIPKTGDTLLYRLLRPQNSDSTKKYPLVLFLHGAGERGKDNEKQLLHGVCNFASTDNLQNYPCYIIAPQCPLNFRWVETDWKLPSHIQAEEPALYLQKAIRLLDTLCKSLNVDTNRIYITGLSMGGFGVWDAACRYHEKFAAAVPVCGGGDTSKAVLLKNIPVWAFHGSQDNLVMPQRSRDMIQAMKNCGGNPKYTEYPDVGHGAWVPAYKDAELYKWLFKQSRELK